MTQVSHGPPHLVMMTQVFPPEIHPTAVMVADLAVYMQSQGWDVDVLAGYPHHGQRRLYEGYRRHAVAHEQLGNIQVTRTWHPIFRNRNVVARVTTFAAQTIGNTLAGFGLPKVDCIITFGPPLLGPVFAAALARRHSARVVNVIHDLHPDIAVETGAVKANLVIHAAKAIERLQYRTADLTVVLSEGFRSTLIARGAPQDKVVVIPVWLDADEIRPLARETAWRAEHGIAPETLVVLYAGTIGLVSGAEIVPDAAQRLRRNRDILFLFVGNGEAKAKVERRVKELDLENVRLLPFQPRERLSEVQSSADLALVTLAPGRGRTSIPSKVIGYMAAGRPIIGAVDEGSETAAQLRDSGAGLVCAPADPDALAASVLRLRGDPGARLAMGAAARSAFERKFARSAVLPLYAQRLNRLAHGDDGSSK